MAGDSTTLYKDSFETVAASQTDQVLGPSGDNNDRIFTLICVVATALTSQVQIKDGGGSDIEVLPDNVGDGVGTYTISFGAHGIRSTAGAWQVTTGAGVAVLAIGAFS